MRTFSYRYKSLIGVEGSWDPTAHVGTVKVVLLGLLVGIDVGVAVKSPA